MKDFKFYAPTEVVFGEQSGGVVPNPRLSLAQLRRVQGVACRGYGGHLQNGER